jgi:hypothetical protein
MEELNIRSASDSTSFISRQKTETPSHSQIVSHIESTAPVGTGFHFRAAVIKSWIKKTVLGLLEL